MHGPLCIIMIIIILAHNDTNYHCGNNVHRGNRGDGSNKNENNDHDDYDRSHKHE